MTLRSEFHQMNKILARSHMTGIKAGQFSVLVEKALQAHG